MLRSKNCQIELSQDEIDVILGHLNPSIKRARITLLVMSKSNPSLIPVARNSLKKLVSLRYKLLKAKNR